MEITVDTPGGLLSPTSILAPLRRFLERSGIKVQGRGRVNAPKDRGLTANAITYQVDPRPHPMFVKIGVFSGGGRVQAKAAGMEWGTGTLSEAPDRRGGQHFPPWGSRNPDLENWARRHGMPNGFVVARAIGRRGGLRPRRYLRNALADSKGDIQGYAQRMATEIVKAAEGRG